MVLGYYGMERNKMITVNKENGLVLSILKQPTILFCLCSSKQVFKHRVCYFCSQVTITSRPFRTCTNRTRRTGMDSTQDPVLTLTTTSRLPLTSHLSLPCTKSQPTARPSSILVTGRRGGTMTGTWRGSMTPPRRSRRRTICMGKTGPIS